MTNLGSFPGRTSAQYVPGSYYPRDTSKVEPLHRNKYGTQGNANRNIVKSYCRANYPTPYTTGPSGAQTMQCDEYPFNVTYGGLSWCAVDMRPRRIALWSMPSAG
ncbi:hypothetical protein [Dactylosporangium sp. NPDC050588]|uniref:hypothetical protein n=1 Tax=Dactylosporangium sp. NPDC050588 TaxID=3157211 RepID=UPI0033F88978